VLVIEFEGARGLERALAALRSAREPSAGLERLEYQAVEGRRALEEYLELIIPVRRLLRMIFRSPIYQYFVAAAPGLKELMAVGKIWYEADRASREGGVGPDLVLVDAPATGHSLQYLRMPQAAFEAFPVGLVHREAERVLSLLRDPAATGVVVVSTAEEMPVNETLEMLAGLDEIGMPRVALVVNQVHTSPCTAEELKTLERLLAATAEDDAAADRSLLEEAVQRAAEERTWSEINAAQLGRLKEHAVGSWAQLPFLFCEEFAPEQLWVLSRELAAQLVEDPASGAPS
jgi:anion-transporting  ArsA/GET3 family ATPase